MSEMPIGNNAVRQCWLGP